jgi:hypothetical protein
VAGWDTTPKHVDLPPAIAPVQPGSTPAAIAASHPSSAPPPPPATAETKQETPKKKGLFRRLWGVFK